MREDHDIVVIGGGQAGPECCNAATRSQAGGAGTPVVEGADAALAGFFAGARELASANPDLDFAGVSPVRGLYFLGLQWMHMIKSGLLSGVGSDAKYLGDPIDLLTGR